MTEVPSPQLRISDQERESALHALGEHMSAGRIDIDEFGERSARITAAKTRGELGELFTDLPVPHPVFGAGATAAPEPAAPPAPVPRAASGEVAAQQPEWSAGQRAVAALIPLVWIAAIALIATGTAGWPVIFAPIALTAVGRALWGKGFEHHDHHRHDRHRERREEFRAMRDEHRRQRRLDR